MDNGNNKTRQFGLNSKTFKDEEKSSSETITFHQQSPRFKNSKTQAPSQPGQQQTQFKDESQNSPCQSPRQQKRSEGNAQVLLSSGGKTTITRAPAETNTEFTLFEYKGEKDFFNKMGAKLNEIQGQGEVQVSKFFEKIYKRVLEEDFSLSSLQRTLTRSKNNWKEFLKVKNASSCQALIGNILPHFQRALTRRSLANIQDLLKITLLYQYEYYLGMEKQLTQILDLFTKMLQIPQKAEEEDTISNHIQRLVLLNIQSFCIPSISSKFQTEFQLIFKRIQELILHYFNTTQSQLSYSNNASHSATSTSSSSISDSSSSNGNYYSFLRFIATLLRTGHIVLLELKENKVFLIDANNQKLTEKVFLRIFKYVFLGNPTFHQVIFGQNQKGILSSRPSYHTQVAEYSGSSNGNRSGSSISSQMNNSFSASSQSEWSENDEMLGMNDKNRIEVIEGKVRNYTCQILQTVIRQFPIILKNQWQTLVKSNNMTKDFVHSLKSHISLDDKGFSSKQKETDKGLLKESEGGQEEKKDEIQNNKNKQAQNNGIIREYSLLYPNYMEVSLLSSLVFEENNRIKINVLQTLSALIENLPSKQLISGLDVQKFEKSTSTFKPQSYLIYHSYKNIHFTLIHLLQTLCNKQVTDGLNENKNQVLSNSPNNQSSQTMKAANAQSGTEEWFINEADEEVLQLCNQILKVYISFFNSTVQLETIPFKEGIDLLLRQFILKVLRHIKTSDASLEALHLKYNALQIINCIARCNIRFEPFATRYLHELLVEEQTNQVIINPQATSIFDLCMEDILLKTSSSEMSTGSSSCLIDISLYQKEDGLREMIALESITLLNSLQINYFDCTLFFQNEKSHNSKIQYPIWEKISEIISIFEQSRNKSSTDKKRLLLLYDLLISLAERRNIALEIVKQIQKKSLLKEAREKQSKENSNNQNAENEEEKQTESADQEDENDNAGSDNSFKVALTALFTNNPCCIEKLKDFEESIFSSYLLKKVQYLIQQSLQQEQIKANDENESPLLIKSLNLSIHIRNDQWISNPDSFLFFKEKIFSLQIIPTVRFHILKTLGCIISCSVFNEDRVNCKQILEILLNQKQLIGQKKTSANLSVYSKLSQSLANWCYYVSDLSTFSQQTLSNLLLAVIDLASSPKDKISPHGLRALGIYLMKMTKSLYTTICNPTKEDGVLCKLLSENLTHKSSKVVWNACVAISNIFSNHNCMLENLEKGSQLQFFFSPKSISQLIHSLEDVLLSINNQKSQIYALRALQSIMSHPSCILLYKSSSENPKSKNEIVQERIPHLLNVLTEIGSNIYSFHNSHHTNKSLGELVVQFLISMIGTVSTIGSNDILIEFIKNKYYNIIHSFSQYIYQLWKNNKLDLHLALQKEESYQDSEKEIFNFKSKTLPIVVQSVETQPENQQINQKETNSNQPKEEVKQQDVYEELLVKGQDEFKSVKFDFEHIAKSKLLKEQLLQLKSTSQILQRVIDQNDDLSVSLIIYDYIKEYASIDLEKSILKFSIH